MAGYRRTSKYSVEDTQKWTIEAMLTLSEEKRAMTCEELRTTNIQLVSVTPQKLARCLSSLCDLGTIRKEKGKDGRMRYWLVEAM